MKNDLTLFIVVEKHKNLYAFAGSVAPKVVKVISMVIASLPQ